MQGEQHKGYSSLFRQPPPRVSRYWLAAIAIMTTIALVLLQRTSLNVAAAEKLKVYVFPHDWCEILHFGGVLRMCRASTAAVKCDINRNMTQLMPLRGSSSSRGTTFGLPVVELDGLQVSQSIAGTVFAGEKLGMSVTVTSSPKAVQYMLDMRDLIDNINFSNPGYDGAPFPQHSAHCTLHPAHRTQLAF